MRAALLGLAAVVLPACGENKIWVNNAGTSDARVDVRYVTRGEFGTGIEWSESHYDSWIVGPGQVGEQDYPSSALEVTISADPGGAILIADVFEYDDFRDEHGRIERTVYP